LERDENRVRGHGKTRVYCVRPPELSEAGKSIMNDGQTFAQKVLAQKAGYPAVQPEQIVEVKPDVVLSHDNTAAIIKFFKQIGAAKVFDPDMLAVVLDHAAPPPSTQHAENHRRTRAFVYQQGLQHFYDVGRGVCHQVLVEEGLALPGEVVLGADSHTTHAGVMGAFGAGLGRSEIASIWAVGRVWLMVPKSLKIVVHGQFSAHVHSKDLALKVIGDLGADGALYRSVEWHGETIQRLSLDQRAVLPNIAAEMGAKNSYIPPDDTVFEYLKDRAKRPFQPLYPDPDAPYDSVVEYEAESIEPMVACPHAVDHVKPLAELKGTCIDQAFLGTCTNGRLEDIAIAAEILRGRRVHPRVRMIVVPASSQILRHALRAGYVDTLVGAGAVLGSPSCGPCTGNAPGVPARGDVVVSTANRNFKGRMGTRESDIYLAAPAVAAASAVAGALAHPVDL
jgi:homoaconitate hydratase family protein